MTGFRRFLSRVVALLTGRNDEPRVDEEIQEHLALLTDDLIRSGMDPTEARRQAVLKFGGVEPVREAWRDQRGLPRVDALMSDVVFGWRQLRKHSAVSAAAVLSLALATGATTAAFRLVDAVLLRKLPVAEPNRLYYLGHTFVDRNGSPDYRDEFDYPTFRRYRDAIADRADAMVIGMVARQDVTFAGAEEAERLHRQYLSGNAFGVFGLQPVAGRLLSPADDVKPGGHPVAVISHEYWTRRFGRDPHVVGKTFRMGRDQFEIVGVAPEGFTGTEPGEIADLFIPAMMNAQAINSAGWSWFRMWVKPKRGVSPEQVQQPLQALFTREHQAGLKQFHSDTPKQAIDAYLSERLLVLPAAAGASRLQKQYRRPLMILSLLVALVLLVACVNVANLLIAQATARAKEMALRVSIGAGRWRLMQLVLVQSALLACAASALGTVFASWAAPLVTSMLRMPGDPVRLVLETSWREVGFSTALAFAVTLVFGSFPAFRASNVQPVAALKGSHDPTSRRRVMNAFVSAQIAFCIVVLFVAGLFVNSFRRLANKPIGFSPENVVILESSTAEKQPVQVWAQVAEHLRQTAGVQSVALAAWPLLSENGWSATVRVPGRPIQPRSPYFLEVSSGFLETMRIGLIDGRDIKPGDVPPRLEGDSGPLPGVGVVNEAFARTYFDGQNPVGRIVQMRQSKDVSAPLEIIGYVRDAAYRNLRDPIPPTVYVPMIRRNSNVILVRTAVGSPPEIADILRRQISRTRADLRVRTMHTQSDYVTWHLIRERLLATLSLFFAGVALVLAGVGLYGILNYSVTRQKREIGIRMALGARAADVIRRITADVALMICLGSIAGLAGGLMSARLIESLLFEVKATDAGMLAAPIVTLTIVALIAGLGPAMRAARIDPARILRSE